MLSLQSPTASPSLGLGESVLRPLERHEGVSVTLGPYAHFFDRPGRSVCKWTGAKTVPRQSPHPLPQRSRIMNELALLARLLFGGGDVRINMIAAQNRQIEVLLTAGVDNVVECIDLARLAREGAPPLLFLQPAYLCSSSNTFFRSVLSDASTASWARAPYVYKTYRQQNPSKPAILCLSGRTSVWRERLEPGERRDFALGNIIAATSNIVSALKPSNQYRVDEFRFPIYCALDAADEDSWQISFSSVARKDVRLMFREARAAAKTFLESIRAREGFFVCEVMNASNKPPMSMSSSTKATFTVVRASWATPSGSPRCFYARRASSPDNDQSAVLERRSERAFVETVELAADGDAMGETRRPDARRLQQIGDVMGHDLAVDGRVHSGIASRISPFARSISLARLS